MPACRAAATARHHQAESSSSTLCRRRGRRPVCAVAVELCEAGWCERRLPIWRAPADLRVVRAKPAWLPRQCATHVASACTAPAGLRFHCFVLFLFLVSVRKEDASALLEKGEERVAVCVCVCVVALRGRPPWRGGVARSRGGQGGHVWRGAVRSR